MPESLMAVNSLRAGELQVYGKMLDAFYPYVSPQGKVDLRRAASDVDPIYEELKVIGHVHDVIRFLTAKAILDIPAIKRQVIALSPESVIDD